MDDLFQKALSDNSAEKPICEILCNNFPLYCTSLQSQNMLAYFYLRNMTSYLLKTNTSAVEYITSHHELLVNLIYEATEKNFEVLLSFYEIISLNGFLWPTFYQEILQHLASNFSKSVKVYATVFKKYETLKASSELYKEINDNIELLKFPLFSNFLNPNYFLSIRNSEDLINIFYYLIYQDIHPFFENNIEKFFLYFDQTFEKHANCLYKIFNLCISKYSDCVDIYKILVLCLSKPNTDSVLIQIIKRREFARLKGYYGQIANYILNKKNSVDEFSSDPLRHTRNSLKNIKKDELLNALGNLEFKIVLFSFMPEYYRKYIFVNQEGENHYNGKLNNDLLHQGHKKADEDELSIIKNVIEGKEDDSLFGKSFKANPGFILELERLVEISTVLRFKLNVKPIFFYCDDSIEGQFLLFRSIIYLLKMGSFFEFKTPLAYSHRYCSYILMHYFSEHFELKIDNVNLALQHLKDEYSAKLLFLNVRRSLKLNSAISGPFSETMLGIDQIFQKTFFKNSENHLCKNGFYYCKDAEILEKNKFDYELIAQKVSEFVCSSIDIINVQPYFYLFDVLGLIASPRNYISLLKLSNQVLTSGVEELFHLNFYLLSILVKFGFDTTGLLSIIHNKDFWSENTLIFPLCCLTVSVINKIEKTFLYDIIEYLLSFRRDAAYFLIAKSDYPLHKIEIEDSEEEIFIRASRKMHFSLEYLEKNYLTTKNVRKLVKALLLLDFKDNESLMRNLENYKDDPSIPYSVCEEFGL